MKRIRIFSLIALMLCLVTVLASCGSGGMLKYINDEYEETPDITVSEKKDFSTDTVGVSEGRSQNLVCFMRLTPEGDSIRTVYNLKTDAIVATVTTPPTSNTTVTFDKISDVEYFTVITRENDRSDLDTGIITYGKVIAATLYNAEGTVIASTTSDPDYERLYDEFKFSNKIYTTDKNGAIVEYGDASAFFDYTDVTFSTDEFLYLLDDSSVAVYDKCGEPLSAYKIKPNYKYYGVLQNGDVCVQYLVPLAADAKKYDLLKNGRLVSGVQYDNQKYDVVTEIFDVKKGTAKEVDIDFLLSGGVFTRGAGYEELLKEDFKHNFALIQRIENKLVDDIEYEFVILDNNLKIKESSADLLDGVFVEDIRCIADGTLLVTDLLYREHMFVDGKLQQSFSSITANDKYLYTDSVIYDYDLNPLYDFGSINYDVLHTGESSVLIGKMVLGKTTEAVLFTNSGNTVVLVPAGSDNVEFLGNGGIGLYGVKVIDIDPKNTTYQYYNEAGTLIGTYSEPLEMITRNSEGILLMRCGNEYYRFTCAASE